jgi:hypothetical protein
LKIMGFARARPTGLDVWRLVHGEGGSMKKAAATLGISVSEAYEHLADERLRRDILAHRQAASTSILPPRR